MNIQPFQALVADMMDGHFRLETRRHSVADLPDGELLIQVEYSSVNYKDALACSPGGNVAKKYPLVPGIDLAGIVVDSRNDRFQKGDKVIVTGFELGVGHSGGYSRYARVPADWVVMLPEGLSLRESMILGTAGFTAALSIHELRQSGVLPGSGPVLVTGATGGVGSLSVAMLAKLGYDVAASTGKSDSHGELLALGASRVLPREAFIPAKPRPLDKQMWAGAVDCVGGTTLMAILSSLRYGGSVAACGLTGGTELNTTVFPFILRGVRLIGIDSVYATLSARMTIWERLAADFKPVSLDNMCTEISLEQVADTIPALLEGRSRGRILVKL